VSLYFDELCRAMEMLAQHPRAIFMGQAVAFSGTAMFNTLRDVPMEKRVELPVFEDCQLGMAIGASLRGDLPVSIFPRVNFLLLATSQLVLHLDTICRYSGYRPKVIIRTAVATPEPLDPGPQHLGDFTYALQAMLKTVVVIRLNRAKDIVPAYQAALELEGSSIIVERTALYDEKV
jgi:pyruvate/2-oxoglutarate/acetoin dehydrogenase E1 component